MGIWLMSPQLFKALNEAGKIEARGSAFYYEDKQVFVDSRVVGMTLTTEGEMRKKDGIKDRWM